MLVTHVKTVDHAKMVSTVTRVAAQLDTVGTIVRTVSPSLFVNAFLAKKFLSIFNQ